MQYVLFVILFTLAHVFSYTIAGAVALKFSKNLYEEKERVCDFMRDMADDAERSHVEKWFLPAQFLRGPLMAVILLPLFSAVTDLSFFIAVLFFGGLMFIYTHLSSVSPFIDNIEGQVYFKKSYLRKDYFWKFQYEMLMYSVLFGFLMAAAVTWIM
ncbi:hypothetical protein [Salisediminibacterium beveridgei]|uniref:Uncharacterized protein n=1 Tax=Salisediminibacterium beveridgei TaxID=632773 RepID=A0A1D7QZE5_9BACI|nr:hypothetical protein [Salisediminibacterium beveridgei]AOM84377.1 hypothetical protein BBEV_3059 [Salisediminibacterium beveridgei]